MATRGENRRLGSMPPPFPFPSFPSFPSARAPFVSSLLSLSLSLSLFLSLSFSATHARSWRRIRPVGRCQRELIFMRLSANKWINLISRKRDVEAPWERGQRLSRGYRLPDAGFDIIGLVEIKTSTDEERSMEVDGSIDLEWRRLCFLSVQLGIFSESFFFFF